MGEGGPLKFVKFCLIYFAGGALNPRDIVDGHREKTLAFLWKLIFHFQVSCVIMRFQCTSHVSSSVNMSVCFMLHPTSLKY